MEAERAVQKELFEPNDDFKAKDVILFALGDFQARGFELAERQIALDRILGALKRAYEIFEILPLDDDVVAEELRRLGAVVKELPPFVAKHPYRLTVNEELAQLASKYYDDSVES